MTCAHLLLFAPEVALNHLDGVVQQLACLRMAGGDGARRAQQDEEMLIALLGGINYAFIVYAGVPAAVLFVAQRTVQGINAVLNQAYAPDVPCSPPPRTRAACGL